MPMISQFEVYQFQNRLLLGQQVARDVANQIHHILKSKDFVSIIFASAPSQNEFLQTLKMDDTIPWEKVICFHLDEYIGLSHEAPQSFSAYLRKMLFDKRKPQQFYYLNGLNLPELECQRYTELLKQYPPDLACIGIGENGHIAFNDPHVADFQDHEVIKVVQLDETSRVQQVNDGCFISLEKVPKQALTLTIPTILSASTIFCTVPGPRKRNAVLHTLYGAIEERYPASILRIAQSCKLYLDEDSYSPLITS